MFYVGDAERDMQAGKNAGMTTVLADWGYILPKTKPKTGLPISVLPRLWICWQSCVKTL